MYARFPLRSILFCAALTAAIQLTGCSEDNPATPPEEPEHAEPTRMLLTLTNAAVPTDTVRATWADPDGIGSQPPNRIDTLKLVPGVTYNGTIRLFNDVKSVELTSIIQQEGDQHQFFYTPDTAIAQRMAVSITDKDAKGLPVGLAFRVVATAAADSVAGRMNVVLSHFDSAPKDGVKRSPESDIDVDFPVIIR